MLNEQSFYTFDVEAIPYLIIYAIVMLISIVIYRTWRKKYNAIPDKTVIAKRIKTSNYFGEGGSSSNYFASSVSYVLAKYEYYIDDRRYTIKFKCKGRVPDEIVLYYKKGHSDIRQKERFSLPTYKSVLIITYFVVGVALITVLISNALGIKI